MKNRLNKDKNKLRYIDVLLQTVEFGRYKAVSIKTIKSKINVGYSTAAKVWDMLEALEWLDTPDEPKSRIRISDEEYSALKTRASKTYQTSYTSVGTGEILEEDAKKFKEVRKNFDYFADLILPALLIGLNYGSVSPTILKRRLGIDSLRGEEVYEILDAMGFLGDVDENADSRRKVLIDAEKYDRLAKRYSNIKSGK